MRRPIEIAEHVKIDKLVPGGRGMGRLQDGRPVFVSGAYPQDEVEILRAEDRRSFVDALEFRLVIGSPHRVEPDCPECDRCGGCDWMRLSGREQLEQKGALIEEALRRTAKISLPHPVAVHPSPRPLQYRSRVRLQVEGEKVGFFSRGSHELVEVEKCVVSSPEVWQLILEVRQVVRQRPSAFAQVAFVEARVLEGDAPALGRASLHFGLRANNKPTPLPSRELTEAVRELEGIARIRLGEREVEPQDYEVHGVRVGAPVGGFTQVNERVNEALVGRVLREVEGAGARTFFDLFCGSGNFTLPLLHRGLSGVGVEYSVEAVSALREAASGLEGEFFSEPTHIFLTREAPLRPTPDVVVVDPPRSGAKECIGALVRMRAPLLLMVSCDPVSLARDLRMLCEGGYRLHSVEGFDMFPQTHHVETLAILRWDETARLSSPAS